MMVDMVRELLVSLGEDPNRPGLVDTPRRVVESWKELFCGYSINPDSLFTVFEEERCDEMVILRDIEFVSHCEHHLMLFSGRAHIGYIPRGSRIVGISKLARLLECYARRLQIQERIGEQITSKLMERLQPSGCGCILEARHSCISCRGISKQNSTMLTSSMKGIFLTDAGVRDEFMRMVGI